ncbi:ABC-F family ATP-binding cassette domain-containing protein [Macrococcus equipercicus]|uniref:ABC-F family ATP-binding cassette domain-containing protein n=1 Tax=Macrococcus equipercicus TaxID=69967 RepID=A0A9Q9BQA5_9STAP|nr:ABC-F family ATP-binding cassette domain-containing protein [Macrococcus equipercicus]UTH13504.1 ABC-F family ATP-binding cassette domain-containing protein [Macrococcus equipercicus]
MILLQASQLTKSFSGDTLFADVKFEIKSNDRVAIVGRNGAGKTTLMKILAGVESYDSGHLMLAKNIRMGYLTQQMTLDADGTVYDAMMKPFLHLVAMERKLQDIAAYLSDESDKADSAEYQEKLTDYEKLQAAFEAEDGYKYDHKIKTVLTGLNFREEDFNQKIDNFSGGQKTRLALAEMLLQEPDLLLLDEPTNHLDMETTAWLENYLLTYKGAIILISHDRYFLDKVVGTVYDVALGRVTKYVGNYSQFIIERDAFYDKMTAEYERQQAEIERLETFVQKNITRASTSGMAKSRRKVLEKMVRIEAPKLDDHSVNLNFNIDRESGNDVLSAEQLEVGYETPITAPISFDVKKQDAIAVIGPNGIGKTTLIKTIAKRLPAISGHIKYGANVTIGYYDQKQAEFSSSNTVLEELWQYYPTMPEKDVRAVLGRFLFVQDDVKKAINDLSGGEKARLQLAKLSLENNNVLILDEPTNHLDIAAKEILEEALIHYPGTVLFVSHDRYFINRIATKVLNVTAEGAALFLGDYTYFIEKEEERAAHEAYDQQEQAAAPKTSSYEDNKQARKERRKMERALQQLEETVASQETLIADIEHTLTLPEVFNDSQRSYELHQQLVAAQSTLEEAIEQWAELEALLEESE